MMDNTGRANIIHYASNRCKRVTGSVLASEIQALVAGFALAYVILHLMQELLNRDISLEAYMDNRTVFDVIAKDGRTCERRLKIYINALRQSYTTGRIETTPLDTKTSQHVRPTQKDQQSNHNTTAEDHARNANGPDRMVSYTKIVDIERKEKRSSVK